MATTSDTVGFLVQIYDIDVGNYFFVILTKIRENDEAQRVAPR